MPVNPQDLTALRQMLDEMRQEQEQESDWVPTLLRAGVPATAGAGSILLSALTGGIGTPAALALGGASAGLGETLAQEYEKRQYGRPRNPLQTLVQTGVGAVPMGKMGTFGSAVLKNAALGGSAAGLSRFAEGETPTATDIAVGAGTGGGVGGVFHAVASPLFRFLSQRYGPRPFDAERYVRLGQERVPAPPAPEKPYVPFYGREPADPRLAPPESPYTEAMQAADAEALTQLGISEPPIIPTGPPNQFADLPPGYRGQPLPPPLSEADLRAAADVRFQSEVDRDIARAIEQARTDPLNRAPIVAPAPPQEGPLFQGVEPARVRAPFAEQPRQGTFADYARNDQAIQNVLREERQFAAAQAAAAERGRVIDDPSRQLGGIVDTGSEWERAWDLTGPGAGPGRGTTTLDLPTEPPIPATRFWQGPAGVVDILQEPQVLDRTFPEGTGAAVPIRFPPPPTLDPATGLPEVPPTETGWYNLQKPQGTVRQAELGELLGILPTQGAAEGLPPPRARVDVEPTAAIPQAFTEAPSETAGYPKEESAADGYLRQWLNRMGINTEPELSATKTRFNWGAVEPDLVPPRKSAPEPPPPAAAEGEIIPPTPTIMNIDQPLVPPVGRGAPPRPRAPRPPGQQGFANPSAIYPLAGGAVGAAIGAPIGATLDEQDRTRGALAGAGLGALLGASGGATIGGRPGKAPPLQTGPRPPAQIAAVEAQAVKQPPAGRGTREFFQATEQEPIPKRQPIPAERREKIGTGNLRHDPQLNAELVKDLDDAFAEADAYTVARGGRQPDARALALAERIKVDLNKKLPPRHQLNDEQTIAYASAWENRAKLASEIKARVQSGQATDEDKLNLVRLMSQMETMYQALEGSGSEAARVLRRNRFLKQLIFPGDVAVAQRAAGGLSNEKFARIMDLPLDDPIALRELISSSRGQTFFKSAMGYYVNNILSGILTQERNLGGNLANLANRLLVRGAAVAGDVAQSALTGRSRQVYAGELREDLIGVMGALQKAMQDARYTLRYGHSVERIKETGELIGLKDLRSDSIFEMEHTELAGGGRNPLNWPSRLLDAGDRFFYQLNKGGEVHSQAYAMAVNEARQAGRAGDAKWIAQQAAKNRLEMPRELTRRVREEARRGVYREQTPPAIAHLLALKEEVPALNMIIPFVRMPYNLLKQGMEHSPMGLVMKQGTGQRLITSLMKGAKPGEERQTAIALGRVLEGTALLTPLAMMAAAGKISGTGPSDPNKKAALMRTGWRPNSFNIPLPEEVASKLGASRSDDGTYWVNYQLFQPVSQPLMALANGFELYREGQTFEDPKHAEQWAHSVALRFANSSINQSFLSGLSNFVGALENPDQFAKQFIGGTATGFVPLSGALTTIQRATDPTVRQTKSPLDVVRSRLPGLSKGLTPKLDVYGREIQREESAWNAMTPIGARKDPVDTELRRLGITLAPPSERLEFRLPQGNVSRLSDQQQRQTLAKARGMADRAELLQMIQSPNYQRAPDWQKELFLRRRMSRAAAGVSRRAQNVMRRGEEMSLQDLLSPRQQRFEGQ